MAITHLLEDFGDLARTEEKSLTFSPEGLEDQRLEAFEQGYQAGWEDAIKAQSDERNHISAELARSLQDLSFTYHEALAAFTSAMRPMLEQLVTSVLPQMAHASLGANVAEQLNELTRAHGGQEVLIRISPTDCNAVSTLLAEQISFPFELVSDPQLAAGQVEMRVGTVERQLDMAEVLQGVADATAGFFHETDKEMKHA